MSNVQPMAFKNELYIKCLKVRSLPITVLVGLLMQGVSEVTPHSAASFVLSDSDTWTESKRIDEGRQTRKNVPSQEQGKHNLHVSHSNTSNQKQALLITYQVKVSGPNGHVTKARVVLDSALSTLFFVRRLVQQLQLPRQCRYFL